MGNNQAWMGGDIMDIMNKISRHVKIFLTGLVLVAMAIGIAGIWGYAGSETVGKALGTMAIIGAAVFTIDAVIYGNNNIKKTP